MTSPAFELRTNLNVAARAAYLDGATDRQIEMILACARATGDYNILNSGRLTKSDAQRIIGDFLERGVEPDYTKSDDELDAEDAAAARVAADAVTRKAHKKASERAAEERREARDAAALVTAKASVNGQKVRHPKFGEGEVVSWDDASVTAVYAGQKKPLRIARTFLVFV